MFYFLQFAFRSLSWNFRSSHVLYFESIANFPA